MPSLEKEIMLEELRNWLSEASSLIVTGYSGLGSNEMNELRGALHESGNVLRVVKNRLASIVMQDEPWCRLLKCVEGPTAFVLISGDPVLAAKVLAGFARQHRELKLRGGLVQSILVMDEEVMGIAKLPGREILLAQFVNSLSSPVAAFMNAITGPIGAFVRSLNAIREKLEGEG